MRELLLKVRETNRKELESAKPVILNNLSSINLTIEHQIKCIRYNTDQLIKLEGNNDRGTLEWYVINKIREQHKQTLQLLEDQQEDLEKLLRDIDYELKNNKKHAIGDKED